MLQRITPMALRGLSFVSIPHRDYCMLQLVYISAPQCMILVFQSLIGIIVCCNHIRYPDS